MRPRRREASSDVRYLMTIILAETSHRQGVNFSKEKDRKRVMRARSARITLFQECFPLPLGRGQGDGE
jgi:hypothetical protein